MTLIIEVSLNDKLTNQLLCPWWPIWLDNRRMLARKGSNGPYCSKSAPALSASGHPPSGVALWLKRNFGGAPFREVLA
eukprot:2750774-Amphidinium_carterae.1